MTESEWLASENPVAMLEYVNTGSLPGSMGANYPLRPCSVRYSDRKLRLFACGCCRLVWDKLTDPRSRHAVEVAERYADGEATEKERAFAEAQARFAGSEVLHSEWVASYAAVLAVQSPDLFDVADVAYQTRKLGLSPAAQAALLRDIFGNPWWRWESAKQYDTTFWKRHDGQGILHVHASGLLSWNDGTIPRLAKAAYDDRDKVCPECRGEGGFPTAAQAMQTGEQRQMCHGCDGRGHVEGNGLLNSDRLAVLADALEEAGVTDEDILRHLREPGPHVRGCWVIDLLAGRA